MKLKRLQIDGYKNVSGCDIDFEHSPLINAVIGSNGSGKSNLIEAILQILIGCYFKHPPRFTFRLEYEAQNREVILQRDEQGVSVVVDRERLTLERFTTRLRDGAAQVFYPELTLVYYSGECQRVQKLIARYCRDFKKLTRDPETDRFRPLFIQSSNDRSQAILLALFAHGHRSLLERLELRDVVDIEITLCSPQGFDPDRHEPKLWNTEGAIRRIVAALEETSSGQSTSGRTRHISESSSREPDIKHGKIYREERTYQFVPGDRVGIDKLARWLEGDRDNLYLALESLRGRGMFKSVSFRLTGRGAQKPFSFEQLSEGEKQLLAVIGAVKLANQRDNLVLLDEPDTHLNPHWSWDYPSMLMEAIGTEKQSRSTVLMATHDPVMISGMTREQVLLVHPPSPDRPIISRPRRHPRGQGIANLLCSSEFFGLPSSLDKETQKLMDERLRLSVKEDLTPHERERLRNLHKQLEIIRPGVSERDPDYVAFLRARHPNRIP